VRLALGVKSKKPECWRVTDNAGHSLLITASRLSPEDAERDCRQSPYTVRLFTVLGRTGAVPYIHLRFGCTVRLRRRIYGDNYGRIMATAHSPRVEAEESQLRQRDSQSVKVLPVPAVNQEESSTEHRRVDAQQRHAPRSQCEARRPAPARDT
jgi:hypothetical protein